MIERNKLEKLLDELTKIAPTLLVIGSNKKSGMACFNSPKDTSDNKKVDIVQTIAMMIDSHSLVHDILLAAVCHYLQQNPDDREKMRSALDIMKYKHFEAKAEIRPN